MEAITEPTRDQQAALTYTENYNERRATSTEKTRRNADDGESLQT